MNDFELLTKAHNLRQKENYDLIWALGIYVQHAVAICLGSKSPYPKSPSQMDKEQIMYNEDGSMKPEFIKQHLTNFFK